VDGAFLTAQLAGNAVVYSVVLTKAKKPLSREDVESHSDGAALRHRSRSRDTLAVDAGASSHRQGRL